MSVQTGKPVACPRMSQQGNVDAGFHIRMALHRLIHALIELIQLAGIETNQMRSQFGNTGANTGSIRWKVGWPQRTDFTVAGKPRVRFDAHDCAVENIHRFSTRPFVAALV